MSWKLCSEGICASRPQSSQPVPNSSSVGSPEAPDDVAALSAANPKAMPGNSCAESAAIPVSQNIRRLMVLCTTEGGTLLAFRIVSHVSIRPWTVARGSCLLLSDYCKYRLDSAVRIHHGYRI